MISPPFTTRQFMALFVSYNTVIWPAQLIFYALGLLATWLLWRQPAAAKRAIPAILSLIWVWNGIAYHYLFFAQINPVARGFAAAFVLQAFAFGISATRSNNLQFKLGRNPRSAAAAACFAYAMLIYPVLGMLAGHGLMAGPMFGVSPCPTTIFTIGMLLAARGKLVAWLAIIPLIWSLIGFAAAVQLNVPEDLGLPIAGLMLLIALAKTLRNGRERDPDQHAVRLSRGHALDRAPR